MFINKDLVDFVYMTSAMLLEAQNSVNPNRKEVVSKPFRMLIENQEKPIFIYPPETYRDFIFYSFNSIIQGDYQKAFDYLTLNTHKIWESMFDK